MSELPKLPGLLFDDTVYEDEEMGVLGVLLPTGGFPTTHAPMMIESLNGNFLACWFVGTYEDSADIHIVCSALGDGETKWSAIADLSRDPERNEQNPSLFLGLDGTVWVIYIAQDDEESGKDNMQFMVEVRCQRSFNDGRSWGEYETVPPELGTFCRQPIQVLSNGRWVFSSWLYTDSPDGLVGDPTGLRISDGQGKSWKFVMIPKNNGHVHASVIGLSSGYLVAFMRHREAKHIHRGESLDRGESWSEPVPTPLLNNNSGISAMGMEGGRITITYNPTSAPGGQFGKVTWPGLCYPAAVALPEDGDKTFPLIRWMERGEDSIGDENYTNNHQHEYPYLIQSKNGMLYLTYTARIREGIKYLRFREEGVTGEKRETTGPYNPIAAQSR